MNDSATSRPSGTQKRAFPRYVLIASADITEHGSGARIAGRVSEISRTGCYLDLLNTLPPGTAIHIRITRDQGVFQASGKIVYAQDRMGMGIAFDDLSASELQILDSWLDELKSSS